MMRVGIAADHGGFDLKRQLVAALKGFGYEILDFGAHKLVTDDDYPDFVVPLAKAVARGEVDQGVEHDDMNILCLGALVIGLELAKELVTVFLNARFSSEERYHRRLEKLLAMEHRARGGYEE